MATRTITITSNSSKGIELAGVTVSGSGASYNSSTKQLTMSSSDTVINNVTFKVKPKNSSKVTSKSLNMKTVVKKAYRRCLTCGTYVLYNYSDMFDHSCYQTAQNTAINTGRFACTYCSYSVINGLAPGLFGIFHLKEDAVSPCSGPIVYK